MYEDKSKRTEGGAGNTEREVSLTNRDIGGVLWYYNKVL